MNTINAFDATGVSEIKHGRITSYHATKGFGFITENNAEQRASFFFHVTACLVEPKVGIEVRFRISRDFKSQRLRAVEVDKPHAEPLSVVAALSGQSAETSAKAGS